MAADWELGVLWSFDLYKSKKSSACCIDIGVVASIAQLARAPV